MRRAPPPTPARVSGATRAATGRAKGGAKLWRDQGMECYARGMLPRLAALLLIGAALLATGGSAATAEAAPQNRPRPGATVPAPAASPAFGAYLVGRFAAEERDTRAAADNLLAAQARDPERRELLEAAFLAALLDGRPDALRLARRLPDHPAAQLVLLGSDAAQNRWERAENRARHLGRQGPLAALQPVLVAWALAGRGQTDQALALLRPLAENGRFRAFNALHAALIADGAGRAREAERHARIAIGDQAEPSLRLALLAANILHRNGRGAEAQRLLDQVADSSDELALAAVGPSRAAALSGRAVSGPLEGMAEAYVALGAALRGPLAEADDLPAVMARLALRVRPGFAPALLLLGDILAESEQHAAALEAFAAVAPGDPLFPVAALRRAGLLDLADDPEGALALLRDAAAEGPAAGQPQPHMRAGDILRRRGRFAEAADEYARAVAKLGPAPRAQDWPVFYARGIARERAGDWEGAETDLLLALDLAPDQPYVLNYLGFTWADQGVNLPRARALLERAAELRPQDGNIADSLGWALFRMGDIPGAIRLLERAVELEPRSATINDHLGDAYWAAGRRDEARFQWSRALGLDPEPQEAQALARKLDAGAAVPLALGVHAVPTNAQAAR